MHNIKIVPKLISIFFLGGLPIYLTLHHHLSNILANITKYIARFKPITMNTSLKHLLPRQQEQLETAKNIIVSAIQPEKIILFGVYSVPAEAAQCNDTARAGSLPKGVGAYDLMVVAQEGDHRSDYELQD